MPVYNGADFITEAVQSILGQTYSDFELLIINDGSTDNTSELIRRFTDRRLRLIDHPANAGLITRLNEGLSLARGRFIARMDADDIAFPQRLARQMEVFNNDPQVIACGSWYYSFTVSKKKLHVVKGGDAYLKSLLLFATCFNHPTVMFRNVVDLRFDPSKQHAEDYAFWTRLAERGAFHIINEPLLFYRIHPKQITERFSVKQKQVSAEIRKDYLDHLGFVYTSADLVYHNQLGDNYRARNIADLRGQELWLLNLERQNAQRSAIEQGTFRSLLFKFWMESCGNSSIGLTAFRMALHSPLSRFGKYTVLQKIRLLFKCLIRFRLPGRG